MGISRRLCSISSAQAPVVYLICSGVRTQVDTLKSLREIIVKKDALLLQVNILPAAIAGKGVLSAGEAITLLK